MYYIYVYIYTDMMYLYIHAPNVEFASCDDGAIRKKYVV